MITAVGAALISTSIDLTTAQPSIPVTVTEYVPAFATVAFGIEICAIPEFGPLGVVQVYPEPPVTVTVNVSPSHIGALLVRVMVVLLGYGLPRSRNCFHCVRR